MEGNSHPIPRMKNVARKKCVKRTSLNLQRNLTPKCKCDNETLYEELRQILMPDSKIKLILFDIHWDEIVT
jgi:hypothetical protein